MIIDKLENLSRYDYVPNVSKAIDLIKNNDLLTLNCGKYDLGDDCFVNVSEYLTKEEPEDGIELEAHVEYLDIQFTVLGSEMLYYQAIELGESIIDYNKKKDIEFFTSAWANSLCLYAGNFALIFPNDLHAGGFVADSEEKVKKFVFKLKI